MAAYCAQECREWQPTVHKSADNGSILCTRVQRIKKVSLKDKRHSPGFADSLASEPLFCNIETTW